MSEEEENVMDPTSLFIEKEKWVEKNREYLRNHFSGKFVFLRNDGTK